MEDGEMKPPSMNRNCICLQITERYLRLFIFICNNNRSTTAQWQKTQEGAGSSHWELRGLGDPLTAKAPTEIMMQAK